MVGDRSMGNGGGQGPEREGAAGYGTVLETDRSGEIDLAKYWSLALKHRLLILGCVIAAVVIAVIVTLMTPPTYTAAATIQIDREAARV
ncbi:MAG TPA: hypothetical protein DCL55_08390, partial [Brevundimonas sp.]|nr:hypothetical protein [Brevundimonas sp.]